MAKLCSMGQQDSYLRDSGDLESGRGASTGEKIMNDGCSSAKDDHTPSELCSNWMSLLSDDLPVSSLTIPGTHDSAAFTSPWPFIATQTMSFQEQLNAGIRYFDLRCGVRNDIVEMVHGRAYLGVELAEVLESMYSWLNGHPGEGLVVQIKQDRASQSSTVHFFQAISSLILSNSERWRTANTTPSLGELRKKIQLFRRFQGPRFFAFGIDVTKWLDNPSTPFTINTWHNVHLTIQDHYTFPGPTSLPDLIATKGGDVARLLDQASGDDDPEHWFINFTSAFEFNWYYQLTPREVAVGGYWAFRWEYGMNPRLKGSLLERSGKRRFGIVAMDFPESEGDEMIDALIQSNFEPLGETKRAHFMPVTILLVVILQALVTLRLWSMRGD